MNREITLVGIAQTQILRLLKEAVAMDSQYQYQQVARIQVQLGEAVSQVGANAENFTSGVQDGLELVIDALYTKALQDAPEMLPLLFPVFALLCGPRDSQYWLADTIDWAMFKTVLEEGRSAEVEQLRAENAALREQLANQTPPETFDPMQAD